MGAKVSSPPVRFGNLTCQDNRAYNLVIGSIYKATSDGFIMLSQNDVWMTFYVGLTNPPTIAFLGYSYIKFSVAKGEYWAISGGAGTIYWRPFGLNKSNQPEFIA